LYVGAEYGYEVSAEVVCERGTALTGQPNNAIIRGQGARSAAIPGDWLVRFQDAYIAEVVQWIESLQTGEPFMGASAWDGYMALRVTDACVESLRTRAPVRIATEARPALYD
jgi:myo-inositol 2-dehydrogenase/D-chiro-inositol 1-dehydrogenase